MEEQESTQTNPDEKKSNNYFFIYFTKALPILFFSILLGAIVFLVFYLFIFDIDLENGIALGFLWMLIICYILHIGLIHPVFIDSVVDFKKKEGKETSILIFGYILLIFFIPFVFSLIFDLATLQSNLQLVKVLPNVILTMYRIIVITFIAAVLIEVLSTGLSEYKLRQYLLSAFGINFISLIMLTIFVDLNKFFSITNPFDKYITYLFLYVTFLSFISSIEVLLMAYFKKQRK